MCPPDFYDVRYEINPWMNRQRGVDRSRAREQWVALYRTLVETVGVEVELVPPVEDLPDFVFTANAGLVYGSAFVPSRFRHLERAREEPHWQGWFTRRGYTVVGLPPNVHFEGEGDVLRCGEALIGGYRFRSDRAALTALGELLPTEVLALELADPWFYHLDTCLCPLTDKTVLYYPEALTPAARKAVSERFPDAVPVEAEEAYRFVCNSVVVGEHVVMSPGCPLAREAVQARGYTVHEVEVGEFLKAGGGAKCLALFLAPAPQERGPGPVAGGWEGQRGRGVEMSAAGAGN
jgi:N-dimethylarginine dimethylaminohydrolase